ncbi:AI-2E family transporter [Arthrobacter pigmenti]
MTSDQERPRGGSGASDAADDAPADRTAAGSGAATGGLETTGPGAGAEGEPGAPSGSGGGQDSTARTGPTGRGRAFITALIARAKQPLPGAKPRRRFEWPPESIVGPDEDAETGTAHAADRAEGGTDPHRAAIGPDDSGDARFGEPGPRLSSRNPIYLGFMGTVGVGFALLMYYIVTNVGQLLGWIAAALFIALGLDPVVRWLEKRQIPRPAGIVISLLMLGGIAAAFISTLIPTIVEQTSQLIRRAPGYAEDFLNSPFFVAIDQQFEVRQRVVEEVQNFFRDSDSIGGIFGEVVNVGQIIANSLFGTLIVLVLTLYFLASLPSMKRWAYRLAPRSRRKRVELLSEAITRSVGNYVIGQACVAVLNATYAYILMSILNVPFALVLAFVVALLAFVPLVGGMIAGILVSLIALTVDWQTAVIYAVFYIAYLQFEAYFISPRIMQKAVAVPGAVAVIAVIAGGSLLGVLGALMAIPTAAAILLLLQELYIARQDRH